jgi:GTPase SAR1 family protein
MSPTYLLKVVAVGPSAVGKTSIILRYTTGSFREHYIPTLGVDFAIKKLELDNHFLAVSDPDFIQELVERFSCMMYQVVNPSKLYRSGNPK